MQKQENSSSHLCILTKQLRSSQKKAALYSPSQGMSSKLEGDAVTYYSIYDNGAVAVMDAFATNRAGRRSYYPQLLL